MTIVPAPFAHLVYGAIDDWEVVQGENRDAVLGAVLENYQCNRVVADVEFCLLDGLSPSLQRELMEEVENLLKTLGNLRMLRALLLKAPLLEKVSIDGLIKMCLSDGFHATANLLEGVRELQPQLRRLADRWISIPEECFSSLSGGRQAAWRSAIRSYVILKTIEASSHRDVEQAWAGLAFGPNKPAERMAFGRISKAIANALFPDYKGQPLADLKSASVNRENYSTGKEAARTYYDSHEYYERAIKQVKTIAALVFEGHDVKARHFLKDLIDEQTSYPSGKAYAVKSLCNIAQQCSEMFRTDFEYECLQSAFNISPTDDWTLIQLADHYKRVGQFEDAINTLLTAEGYSGEQVYKSSLADVYVHMGRFDEALSLYSQIPGGESDPAVRGAIADVLRRRGDIGAARLEYEKIIKEGLDTHRAYAGLAEIAKRQGLLPQARKYYEDLLADPTTDKKASIIYRSALAQILVREGNFSRAYQLLDEVVQLRPFARQFLVFRAAVSGLLGQPENAIKGLKQIGQTRAFDEWVNEYVRGLLLLMLNRYEDARIALIKNLEGSLLDNDAQGIVHLGAAVCFLRTKGEVAEAAKILEKMPETEDSFVIAIQNALKYHIAVTLRQREEISRLREKLAPVAEEDLQSIVHAIDEGLWGKAWTLEVGMVLRLAA
ncbi:MAG: tetratricopeptide repeat protein [Rectinemataceae bacterium]|jgi:tetratricopeptide (TPR) repeat protein